MHSVNHLGLTKRGSMSYVEKNQRSLTYLRRQKNGGGRTAKYDRRVQVGFQKSIHSQCKWKRSNFSMMEVNWLTWYGQRTFAINQETPWKSRWQWSSQASLHYDYWRGTSAIIPYNEKKVPYNWHWPLGHWKRFDTGKTRTTQFDCGRWGMNKNEHPVFCCILLEDLWELIQKIVTKKLQTPKLRIF